MKRAENKKSLGRLRTLRTNAAALAALAPQALSTASFPVTAVAASLGIDGLLPNQSVAQNVAQPAIAAPLGTIQAWNVEVTYKIDAGKLAREQGGKVNILKLVPPSISGGTSQNQEINATLTADDGSTGRILTTPEGDKVLLLKVNSNSGNVYFKLTGTVFNRDMKNIKDGKVELSMVDRIKFTKGYRHLNMNTPSVGAALRQVGLMKGSAETDSAFVERACVWLAKNKMYAKSLGDGSDVRMENPENILSVKTLNCNGASACLALICRHNGIPYKCNPRVVIRFDGSTDLHSDSSVYLKDKRMWVGISGAGLLSGSQKLVSLSNSVETASCFAQDVDPKFAAVLIDTDDDVGHSIRIPGVANYYSYFNEQSPWWMKVNESGKVVAGGRIPFTISSKITAIAVSQSAPVN